MARASSALSFSAASLAALVAAVSLVAFVLFNLASISAHLISRYFFASAAYLARSTAANSYAFAAAYLLFSHCSASM